MSDIVKRLRERNFSVFDGIVRRMSDPLSGEAADEIERLRGLLKECADELADQVEGHYAATKDHPAMKRRYDRDMAPVVAARAALTTSHQSTDSHGRT